MRELHADLTSADVPSYALGGSWVGIGRVINALNGFISIVIISTTLL